MRIAREQLDVRMRIPGVAMGQRRDFGNVIGFDRISGEYLTPEHGDSLVIDPMIAKVAS